MGVADSGLGTVDMQKHVLARHRPHPTLEGHTPQPAVSLPSGYTCHVLLVAQALLTVPLAVYKSVVEKVDVGGGPVHTEWLIRPAAWAVPAEPVIYIPAAWPGWGGGS